MHANESIFWPKNGGSLDPHPGFLNVWLSELNASERKRFGG